MSIRFVTRARPHRHQPVRVRAGQRHLVLKPGRAGKAEPRTEGGVETLGLGGVDRDRRFEPGQVVRAGGDHQQPAGRPQHPVELGPVARREDVEHQVGRAVGQRQAVPGVGGDRVRPRMGPGGPPDRRGGDVQGQPDVAGQPVQDRRQVVTGACPDIHDEAIRRREVDCRGGERIRDRPEVAGRQNRRPGRDHVGRVGAGRDPAGQQVHVSLTGQVEAVPGGAAQPARELRQGVPADRASQPGHDLGVHPEPLTSGV